MKLWHWVLLALGAWLLYRWYVMRQQAAAAALADSTPPEAAPDAEPSWGDSPLGGSYVPGTPQDVTPQPYTPPPSSARPFVAPTGLFRRTFTRLPSVAPIRPAPLPTPGPAPGGAMSLKGLRSYMGPRFGAE